jgi:hypothetical protein
MLRLVYLTFLGAAEEEEGPVRYYDESGVWTLEPYPQE